MDLIKRYLQSSLNNNDEEEDYDDFFLQPASCPYNMAEKIQQANMDLFNNSNKNSDKTTKVKFKDQLTTYEPDLTEDDVNSIESDSPSELNSNIQILEYKTNNNNYDINEEEIIEEIVADYDNIENNFSKNQENIDNNLKLPKTTQILLETPKKLPKRRKTKRKKSKQVRQIECKTHCIDKLDVDLSISIKKLQIHDKPTCPLLKLQPRQCCYISKSRYPQNLPCYNGLHSEYGLSSAELEQRKKRKEQYILKEQKRQQLLQEYRLRKVQQNEEVFSQWLREVTTRKNKLQKTKTAVKQCFSPNVVNFPKEKGNKDLVRPRTANDFLPKHSIKRMKRPYTSPCVFIELPHKLLEKGVCIGDLLIKNSGLSPKKMHILTMS